MQTFLLRIALAACFFVISIKPCVSLEIPGQASGINSALLAYEEGYRLYRNGDLWGAERRFQEALQHEPNLLKAHYWLGKVYRELGMLKESVFHWEEVLRLQSLIKKRRLALALENNEYPAEHQIVSTRVRQREGEEAFRKGRALLEEGHWEGAIVELKNAVEKYPSQPEFLKLLARLLWDQSDLQGSARVYSDLLEVRGIPRELALEAIDRLILVGSLQQARRGLQALLVQTPQDSEVRTRLAKLEITQAPPPAAAGTVVRVMRGQVVLDIGLENGLKLADEYRLRFRSFRPGDPVTNLQTGKTIGRSLDRISANLMVTKVFARSCWALVQQEFGMGVKEGDLIEVQADRK
ncbi:hypothetical protein AUK22_00250 [bacterium CG2_30_54_10]|nr:MAG: hypothetical protein AUK22_00250 [bacterium CG2_30_54_10]